MGDLRFSVPNFQDFDPRVWETAYITGIEGIPWLCHHSLEGQQFSIGREIEESGKLNLVWPTNTSGNVCLSTTSLRPVEGNYSLAVEVARGTVYRLKSQTFEWQRIGLRLPEAFFPLAEQSLTELLWALTSAKDPKKQIAHSQAAIDLALEASNTLCETFSNQALEARRNTEGRLSTLLGARLQKEFPLENIGEAILTAFNLFSISADFAALETKTGAKDFAQFDQQLAWANENHQKVCIGPLIDFRDGGLPDWMFLLEQSFDGILESACMHARTVVERYRGKTHLWNCATGLNVPNRMGWSDEELLRMAVSLIETVRRADDRCPVLLTIDQPWSEYLRGDANGISPLHYADALIRADLGLSGLALELNFDAWPGGSFPRDPIEVSRLIDRWSMLGLPLMIIISCPTSPPNEAMPGNISSWNMHSSTGRILPESIIKLLISKPSVHAVIWNHLGDRATNRIGGAGLWTPAGKAKPLLTEIARLRKTYLH